MGGEYNHYAVECEEKDLKEYFSGVIQEAQYDYGHAGYTGSFAEKDSVEVIPHEQGRFWLESEAHDHCSENNDKWGPAGAYQLGLKSWYIGGWCSS